MSKPDTEAIQRELGNADPTEADLELGKMLAYCSDETPLTHRDVQHMGRIVAVVGNLRSLTLRTEVERLRNRLKWAVSANRAICAEINSALGEVQP